MPRHQSLFLERTTCPLLMQDLVPRLCLQDRQDTERPAIIQFERSRVSPRATRRAKRSHREPFGKDMTTTGISSTSPYKHHTRSSHWLEVSTSTLGHDWGRRDDPSTITTIHSSLGTIHLDALILHHYFMRYNDRSPPN